MATLKRVLYVIPSSEYAEPEQKLLHLLTHLHETNAVSVVVGFLYTNFLESKLKNSGIECLSFGGTTGLARYLQSNHVDIVHFYASKRVGQAIIQTIPHYTKVVETVFNDGIKGDSTKLLDRNKIHATIFDNQLLQQEWDVNGSILQHGINKHCLTLADRAQVRSRYNLSTNSATKLVGLIHNSRERLNVNFLFQLAKIIKQNNANLRIVIYCSDANKKIIVSKVRTLQLEQVLCVDNLSNVPTGAFDVLLDISTAKEIKVSTLESLICKIPVVLLSTPLTQQLQQEGVHGFLFNSRDPIEMVVKYLQTASTMDRSKIGLPRTFNLGLGTEKLLKVYESTSVTKISQPTSDKIYCIVPYGIYGGAEIYLENHIKQKTFSNMHLVFLRPNKLQNQVSGIASCSLVNGPTELGTFLLSEKANHVYFYNSANIYRLLVRIKKFRPIKITEIVHSFHSWPDSMHNANRLMVDKTIVVSATVARQWGIMDFEVLPPVIDEIRFKVPKVKHEGIVVGTVARMSPEKNLKRVIDIAAHVGRDFKFVIVGADGGSRQEIIQYAKQKGVAGKITLKTHTDQIEQEYANFDIFLLTSHVEGLPITVLEALAAGLPVVAPDVGSIKEVVGRNGLVYDPKMSNQSIANHIRRLVKAPIRTTIQEAKRAQLNRREKRQAQQARQQAKQKMLVSFYMPAYNAERYIGQAIESVLNQTYPNVEVCICDDGSTDGTLAFLQKNYQRNKRVRWVSQENKGIGAASNRAIQLCKGKIIAQLDSDDFIEPTAIEKIMKVYADNPEVGAVYTDYDLVNEQGEFIERGWSYPEFNMKMMLHRMIVHPLRTFRHSVWLQTIGCDETLENAVDYDLQMKLAFACDFKIYHLREPLYKYRQVATSTSNTKRAQQANNTRKVIENALKRENLPYQVQQSSPGSFAMRLRPLKINNDKLRYGSIKLITKQSKSSSHTLLISNGEVFYFDHFANSFTSGVSPAFTSNQFILQLSKDNWDWWLNASPHYTTFVEAILDPDCVSILTEDSQKLKQILKKIDLSTFTSVLSNCSSRALTKSILEDLKNQTIVCIRYDLHGRNVVALRAVEEELEGIDYIATPYYFAMQTKYQHNSKIALVEPGSTIQQRAIFYPHSILRYFDMPQSTLKTRKRMGILSGSVRQDVYPFRSQIKKFPHLVDVTRQHPTIKFKGTSSTVPATQWQSSLHHQRYIDRLSEHIISFATPAVSEYFVSKYYEIPFAGCLLLGKPLKNKEEMRLLGFCHLKNCLLFDNISDLRRCYLEIIKDPMRFQEIATAGQKLIQEMHTSDKRYQYLKRVLSASVKSSNFKPSDSISIFEEFYD